MEGPSLLKGDQPHHTEHLCTGFMGEFLGQWKTRPNSSNCETLPRTLAEEERTSELGTPCPLRCCLTPLTAHAQPSRTPPLPQGYHPECAGTSSPKGAHPTLHSTDICGQGWQPPCPQPPHFGSTQYL